MGTRAKRDIHRCRVIGRDLKRPAPAKERNIVTPRARQAAQDLACANPALFITNCRDAQFVSLDQLPWWPAFQLDFPLQALALRAEAGRHGIAG